MPRMRKKTEYYVNNKEFLAAITVYRNSVIQARDDGSARPRVPNYIGECFLKIATHLSYKPNFVNYMFREDMICDGIENCLQYMTTLTQKNPRTHLLILLRLYTMHSCVGYRRRKSNWRLKERS